MFVNHSAPQAKKAWIPKSSLEHFPVSNSSSNAGSDNQGIDLSLHLNQGPIKGVNTRLNFVEAVNKGKPPILSGANVEPLGTPAWPNKHSPPPTSLLLLRAHWLWAGFPLALDASPFRTAVGLVPVASGVLIASGLGIFPTYVAFRPISQGYLASPPSHIKSI